MSYEITGLDFKNTSATVTAKITYFDGTETYKEAISEFFRSGMQQLFTGGDMTPAQNEELLSEILTEKAKDLPDTLTTTTIKYPCEKENGNWIITEVNEDTINVITANFGAFTTELEESEENLNSLSPTALPVIPEPKVQIRLPVMTVFSTTPVIISHWSTTAMNCQKTTAAINVCWYITIIQTILTRLPSLW